MRDTNVGMASGEPACVVEVRSLCQEDPLEKHNNSAQYSCLENPTDRGAWWVTVHRVANSWK